MGEAGALGNRVAIIRRLRPQPPSQTDTADTINRPNQPNRHNRQVLTTHSMEEADVLGDRIAIIAGGRLRCLGHSLVGAWFVFEGWGWGWG
jgi:hypothetical protein